MQSLCFGFELCRFLLGHREPLPYSLKIGNEIAIAVRQLSLRILGRIGPDLQPRDGVDLSQHALAMTGLGLRQLAAQRLELLVDLDPGLTLLVDLQQRAPFGDIRAGVRRFSEKPNSILVNMT